MANLLIKTNLRWVGYVERISHQRLPRQLFYSLLCIGERNQGRPRLKFKDTVKEKCKGEIHPKGELATTLFWPMKLESCNQSHVAHIKLSLSYQQTARERERPASNLQYVSVCKAPSCRHNFSCMTKTGICERSINRRLSYVYAANSVSHCLLFTTENILKAYLTAKWQPKIWNHSCLVIC